MTLTLNEEPIPNNADVIYVGHDRSHFWVAQIVSFATATWLILIGRLGEIVSYLAKVVSSPVAKQVQASGWVARRCCNKAAGTEAVPSCPICKH